ncbi:hypothetical protein BLNAU_626 [Blattamonas nauphoetae]|uniref:G-protein coupled receptors family 1 profile domain-containing protein n=1 Tax=Blattamonas nauphoetae TaxID=2049346 RepID=A0ABQ9YK02_9EUKA|nr:hypothetical protein BLNAU_626 [Blattamonas nauphoetae]
MSSEPISPLCQTVRWTDFSLNVITIAVLLFAFVKQDIYPLLRYRSRPVLLRLLFRTILPISSLLRAINSLTSSTICGHVLKETTTATVLLSSANYLSNVAFIMQLINWMRILEKGKEIKPRTIILTIFTILFSIVIPATFIVCMALVYQSEHDVGTAINTAELIYFVALNWIIALLYGIIGFTVVRYVSQVLSRISSASHATPAQISGSRKLKHKIVIQSVTCVVLFSFRSIFFIITFFILNTPILITIFNLIKAIIVDTLTPIFFVAVMETKTVTKGRKKDQKQMSFHKTQSRKDTSASLRRTASIHRSQMKLYQYRLSAQNLQQLPAQPESDIQTEPDKTRDNSVSQHPIDKLNPDSGSAEAK